MFKQFWQYGEMMLLAKFVGSKHTSGHDTIFGSKNNEEHDCRYLRNPNHHQYLCLWKSLVETLRICGHWAHVLPVLLSQLREFVGLQDRTIDLAEAKASDLSWSFSIDFSIALRCSEHDYLTTQIVWLPKLHRNLSLIYTKGESDCQNSTVTQVTHIH